MRILLLLALLPFRPAFALARAPAFPETHCAQVLATMNDLPLIQPSDLRTRIDRWPLSDEIKAELKADINRHTVQVRIASLKGPALERFTQNFGAALERLDESVAEHRRYIGAQLSPRRMLAGALTLAAASLTAMALFADQHWSVPVAGHLGLLGAGVLGWRSHFDSAYGEIKPTLAQMIQMLDAQRVLSALKVGDHAPEMKSERQAAQVRTWLRRDFARGLGRVRGALVSVNDLETSIEYTRRWGWLQALLPGRSRVIVTYFLMRDEQGDKRLTIVTRVKPR